MEKISVENAIQVVTDSVTSTALTGNFFCNWSMICDIVTSCIVTIKFYWNSDSLTYIVLCSRNKEVLRA